MGLPRDFRDISEEWQVISGGLSRVSKMFPGESEDFIGLSKKVSGSFQRGGFSRRSYTFKGLHIVVPGEFTSYFRRVKDAFCGV